MNGSNTYGGYVIVFVEPGEELSPKLKREYKKQMEEEIHKVVKKLCKRKDFWIEKRTKIGEDFLYPDKEFITIGWKIKAPQIEVPRKIVLVENGEEKEIQLHEEERH